MIKYCGITEMPWPMNPVFVGADPNKCHIFMVLVVLFFFSLKMKIPTNPDLCCKCSTCQKYSNMKSWRLTTDFLPYSAALY